MYSDYNETYIVKCTFFFEKCIHLNISKNKKITMKIKRKTSILKHPSSLRVTIPQPIVELYELNPKDKLEWEVTFGKDAQIKINIIKEE